MTVTLEAEISPGMSPDDFVDLAVRCEQAGFDRFGVSDVVFWPDCFVLDRYDPPELFDLVTEDWIRRYAIVGAPSEIAEQVTEVTALGFTSASLNLAAVLRRSAAEGYAETIDGFGSVLDDCR